MKTLKILVTATRILAILCLIAGLLSHLALTDIAHGELDARTEWLILQLTAVLFGLFILSALITLQQFAQAIKLKE